MAARKKKTEDDPVKAVETPVEVEVKETPTTTKKAPREPSTPTKKGGVVTASLLNFRTGAGKEYHNLVALPQLRKGQKVEILETLGEWSKIKVGNHIGYVMSKHVEEVR